MRDPKEQALLERLQAGDEAALVELVESYGTKIFKLAFRYLKNKEDAEEITQDVLYRVFRNCGTFRGDAALSSWIYRITFNAAMSRVRTASHQRMQQDDRQLRRMTEAHESRSLPREPADSSSSADERILRSQLRTRALGAILALPVIYRAPVVLRDLQGLSTEEASAVLRVKDQTLKSRLHRGRLILRKQLADFAGGLSMHRPVYGT